MKKSLFALVATLLLSATYAQEKPEPTQNNCQYYSTIQGPLDIQSASEQTYSATIEGTGGVSIQPSEWSSDSTFSITQNNKKIASFPAVSSFSHRFEKDGIYTITHTTKYKNCPISTTATITTYKHSITYIGANRTDLNKTIIDNLKQRNILLYTQDTKPTEGKRDQTTLRHQSEIVIVSTENQAPIQNIISQVSEQLKPENTIVIISDATDDLNKKIFGSIIQGVKQPVYVTSTQKLKELILLRRAGERDQATQEIQSSLHLNTADGTTFGFNSLINALLYQGIPLPVIASMLIIGIVALALIFLRQVVGIEVFSIYYPILGGVTFLLVGTKLFFIFLFIARLAHFATHFLANKLSILAHAKIGIYITFYVIFAIVALGIITTQIPDIDRSYIPKIGIRGVIGAMFATIIIGQKIFSHSKNRHRQLFSITLYVAFVLVIAYILTSTNIQYRTITHTRIIFFVVILSLLLGRFTGMKLLEYKRFWGLLWKEMKKRK